MRRMFSKKQIENIADGVVDIAIEELTIPATKIDSGEAEAGKVLMANGSGSASWQTPATYMSNPMTAAGDLIVGGNAGAAGRLGLGTSGQVVQSNGTGVEWADNVPASVSYLTTAPSSDNTSGRLTFVILNSEPGTKYNGYLYIILGS